MEDIPISIIDSILLINILRSARDFSFVRCVSRRFKKLTDENYHMVDMSDHPVKPFCNFEFVPTNFTERCLLVGNPDALFNRGICLLRLWHVDAAMFTLKKATELNHLPATYIYCLFKLLDGCGNALDVLSFNFDTRDDIDWCRYIVWSSLSYCSVIYCYKRQNTIDASFKCMYPKDSVYPLPEGVTGSDEIEWPPYNKKNCCHTCFWKNEIFLYMQKGR
ncbi:hypothetical protein ACFE04_003078 [Oxalis oulophora]